MTGARVCVTNLLRDLRSCTIRGAHRSTCDGWAYRYDPASGQTRAAYRIEWDRDLGTNVRTLVACSGCMPRPAETGLLCESHAAKMRHALAFDDEDRRLVVDLGMHLWATDAGAISDGNDRISTAYGSRWPLVESRVVCNEMFRELDALAFAIATDLDDPWEPSSPTSPRHGFASTSSVLDVALAFSDLLAWIESRWERAALHPFTAEAIVRIIDTITTALHRFPLADKVHRIPAVRCPACGRMSLEWLPPLFHLDEVVVACDACGHRTDQDYVAAYIAAVHTDPRAFRA